MAKKSIEDVMNEIEDFLNSCKTSALSSNKVVVPRDEFDELFGDLKVRIPAEIERCKKIMRNKEAILMEARKNADGILAQATAQANQMVAETEIMNMANQQAYETVEMARAQANDIITQAMAQADEIRLGSMQYTNDIMTGLRDYMVATMEAERANYENLISAFNNECMIANANLEEVQKQIAELSQDPNRTQNAPQFKTAANAKNTSNVPKTKQSMVQKMKQAVAGKDEKEESKPTVNIPDFIASGEKVVPNETPLEDKKFVKKEVSDEKSISELKDGNTFAEPADAADTKKVKKKIIKKRTPVIQTPQTAQETVARTVEAAAGAKIDKTVYKANGEQAREVSAMEGRVKRGPRVGRGVVENTNSGDAFEVTTQSMESVSGTENGKSMGVIDDYAMEKKI